MITGISLFLSLFNNLATFILLAAAYGFMYKKLFNERGFLRQIVMGCLFGVFAIACMFVKIPVAEGVIVDQRNAIVVLSGIFGGPFSAIVSAIIASVYRRILGGSGVTAGIIGLSLSAISGIVVNKFREKIKTMPMVLLTALLTVVIILPGFLFIGTFHEGWELLKKVAIPYGGAIYTGLLFVGLLLYKEEHRINSTIALLESESRYKKLFEDIIDISFHTDTEGNIVLISPSVERILGYNPEQIIGENINNYLKSPISKMDFYKEIKLHGHLENFENEVEDKNGAIVWISTNARILKDKNGTVTGIEGISRDITKIINSEKENKRLMEQLLHKSKMDTLGQLTGGIAHDFNNILTGIIGVSQLLTQPHVDETGSEYVDLIVKASSRGSELTKKLLLFSRNESIQFRPTDLHSIIRETVDILQRTIPKSIAVSSGLNAEETIVLIDSSGIQNALMNLGINAGHAINDHGEICFKTKNITLGKEYCKKSRFNIQEGKYLEITVSDTGCGIPVENIKKIFEPFYTTKEPGTGTGLGLAAVYRSISDNGGAIEVNSTVGVGTTFLLYLPVQ